MKNVSVIIPTYNRPELLLEAIASVKNQTYQPYEVIVVDDGSTPPVDADMLRRKFDLNVIVLRNAEPNGSCCWARIQGVRAASGDIVIHLDDDDLLAPETLSEGVELFEKDAELEVVFINSKGFGSNAEYYNRVQNEVTQKLIKTAKGTEIENGVMEFKSGLFTALLKSVPSAFQRVMALRSAWENVNDLRISAYRLNLSIADNLNEGVIKKEFGIPLRDSEWALYASIYCKKVFLLNRPRYLTRCSGQERFSAPSQRELHIRSGVRTKEYLFKASQEIFELKKWQKQIKQDLADVYFAASHSFFYYGIGYSKAWEYLAKSFRTRPCLRCVKFAVRMFVAKRCFVKNVASIMIAHGKFV